MAKTYDISVLISEAIPAWPGDRFVFHREQKIAKGDVCNKSFLEIGSHVGTHVDAPYHFEEEGKTIEQLDPGVFLGPATVVAFPGVDEIGLAEMKSIALSGVERILFKTRNSELWREDSFREGYAYLTVDACRALAEARVKLVGVDYLSVEGYNTETYEGHHVLLGENVAILEGLDLSNVVPGEYELVALPLKIAGGDGSPVRAVLREIAPR